MRHTAHDSISWDIIAKYLSADKGGQKVLLNHILRDIFLIHQGSQSRHVEGHEKTREN